MRKIVILIVIILVVVVLIGSNYFWFTRYTTQQNENLTLTALNVNLKNDNLDLLTIFSIFTDDMASREASVAAVASEAAFLLDEIDERAQKTRLEEEKLSQLSAQLSDYDKQDCNQLTCAVIDDDIQRMKCVDEKVACYQDKIKQREELKILMSQIKNDEETYQRLIEEAKREAENMGK